MAVENLDVNFFYNGFEITNNCDGDKFAICRTRDEFRDLGWPAKVQKADLLC